MKKLENKIKALNIKVNTMKGRIFKARKNKKNCTEDEDLTTYNTDIIRKKTSKLLNDRNLSIFISRQVLTQKLVA